MRKLKFDYSMELKFSSPVSSHYFALRCVPGDSLRQKITLVECRVSPADYTSADKDGFGNLKISGGCRRLHDMFRYYVAGTAVDVYKRQDQGEIQQYAPPKELLHHPATEFVGRLVEQERRMCHLPDDRLEECEYSGAGAK